MNALGDSAAALGFPVFACGANKRPVVEGGFKAASTERPRIMSMFANSGAALIGMPTGRVSGFIVIDVDIHGQVSGMAWYNENKGALPRTRLHSTMSGGLHLVFRYPDGAEIRNSASRIAPGIDVRGDGGYIIVPPSPGYIIVDDAEPAQMPAWLIGVCSKPQPQAQPEPACKPSLRAEGGSPYGRRALDEECEAIRTAPFGQQEVRLNAAGLKIGALVAGGELEEGIALAGLLAAGRGMSSQPGKPAWIPADVEVKTRRAFEDGKRSPRQAPPRAERPQPNRHAPEAETKPKAATKSKLTIISPVDLMHRPVPEREWVVQDWLPVGTVTANYGDGGVGKSLLTQQLMTGCATATPWCGLAVLPCRSFGLFCEDDPDELHLRQDKINQAIGVNFSDLKDMAWVSGVGQDNTLVSFDGDGRMRITDRFSEIRDAILAHGARLANFDPAADLFAGNENDRHQVRQFMNVLGGLALEMKGAVLLSAHPSRAGMTSGSHDGASTAWSNSARSRWSLTRPPAEERDAAPDMNERILTRRKANYASTGETIALRWTGGVLVPLTQEGGVFGSISRANAEAVFLTLLDRCWAQGVFLSHNSRAGNYAPRVFGGRPDRDGYSKQDFERALTRLIAASEVRVEHYTLPSRHSGSRLARPSSPSESVP